MDEPMEDSSSEGQTHETSQDEKKTKVSSILRPGSMGEDWHLRVAQGQGRGEHVIVWPPVLAVTMYGRQCTVQCTAGTIMMVPCTTSHCFKRAFHILKKYMYDKTWPAIIYRAHI